MAKLRIITSGLLTAVLAGCSAGTTVDAGRDSNTNTETAAEASIASDDGVDASSANEASTEETGVDAPAPEAGAETSVLDVQTMDVPSGMDAGMDAVVRDVVADTAIMDVAADRGVVDAGPLRLGGAHPRVYLNDAVRTRLRGRLMASAPAATRFRTMVDQQLTSGNVYGFESWYAALLGQLTGEARYCDYAVRRIDTAVTAEERLITMGMRAAVAGDSYLEVGPIIGDLSLTYDWCYDRLTAEQRTRWLRYANQAVYNVWNPMRAQWGGRTFTWSGWSVDNPVNNYYFSFLRATALLGLASYGEDPQAAEWVRTFREVKIRDQLVPTYQRDLVGGGSREGTGYGVAMAQLFRLYDFWEQSTGERIAELTPHARESLTFHLHSIVPALDRIVPVGDHARDSTAALFDYHRDYAQTLQWLFARDPMAQRSKWIFERSTVQRMQNGFMFFSDFIYDDPALTATPATDVYPAFYGAGTGQLSFRTGFAATDTLVHMMCGPYTESHAHHDQGSFLLFRREWLAGDANVLAHSGIQQGVRAHSLVRLDRGTTTLEQREGAMAGRLLAMSHGTEYAHAICDTTAAYGTVAGLGTVERTLVFLPPDVVVVFDRVRTTDTTMRSVWQWVTPTAPMVSGRSATARGMNGALTAQVIHPAMSTLRSVTMSTEDADFRNGYRLDATDDNRAGYFLVVLSIDDAVMSATADDVMGRRGVRITRRNGTSATIRFNETASGLTVQTRAADGTVRVDETPAMTVARLPLFSR